MDNKPKKKEKPNDKSYTVSIKEGWCKSCKICVEFCPQDVFEMQGFYASAVNEEKCTSCKLCERLCPEFAITVQEKNSENENNKVES